MREYCKVSPRLWTGELARKLHGKPVPLLVATYLVSSPHSNLIGLYRLPVAYIAEDLGLSHRLVRDALKLLGEHGFVVVDNETGRVWIVEAARHELSGKGGLQPLKHGDKRRPAIWRELREARCSHLHDAFLRHYGVALGLQEPPTAESEEDPLGDDRSHEETVGQEGQTGQPRESPGVLEEPTPSDAPDAYTTQVQAIVCKHIAHRPLNKVERTLAATWTRAEIPLRLVEDVVAERASYLRQRGEQLGSLSYLAQAIPEAWERIRPATATTTPAPSEVQAVDVDARLQALNQSIPEPFPQQEALRAAILDLQGCDVTTAEDGLGALQRTYVLGAALNPEEEREVASNVETALRPLRSRLGKEQLQLALRSLRIAAVREMWRLPDLSLFSPSATARASPEALGDPTVPMNNHLSEKGIRP